MAEPGPIRYTWNGAYALGYQVTGDGRDLIYLPGWEQNLDWNWTFPVAW